MPRFWIEVHYILKVEEDDGVIRPLCDELRAEKVVLWKRVLERVEEQRAGPATDDTNSQDITTDLSPRSS